MGTILTYSHISREKSFCDLAFSDADSLILSAAAYYDFAGSPFEGDAFTTSLGEWFRGEGADCALRGAMTEEGDRALMSSLAQGGRHGDLKACGYVTVYDAESVKQFSAITFQLQPDVYFIAFRGTDNTVVGWKEDMQMYYLPEIPAQGEAREYAAAMMERFPGKFYLGGHSKGGNLAVYTASTLPKSLQDRLIAIYDHDGPGFPREFYDRSGYQAVADRISKTLPRSSVIGLMLENGKGYTVVESAAEGLYQHNLFTWQMDGTDFVTLPEVDAFALHVDMALTQWTEGMDQETRKKLVDLVFDIILSTGIEAFAEMSEGTMQHLRTILNYLKEMSGEEKKLLITSVKTLLSVSAEEAREMREEERKRKLNQLRRELEEKHGKKREIRAQKRQGRHVKE